MDIVEGLSGGRGGGGCGSRGGGGRGTGGKRPVAICMPFVAPGQQNALPLRSSKIW